LATEHWTFVVKRELEILISGSAYILPSIATLSMPYFIGACNRLITIYSGNVHNFYPPRLLSSPASWRQKKSPSPTELVASTPVAVLAHDQLIRLYFAPVHSPTSVWLLPRRMNVGKTQESHKKASVPASLKLLAFASVSVFFAWCPPCRIRPGLARWRFPMISPIASERRRGARSPASGTQNDHECIPSIR
jgi:hypothetical protein